MVNMANKENTYLFTKVNFLIQTRNELHKVIFLENLLQQKLLTLKDRSLFEKINQYIYCKLGAEKIKELCADDLKRELEIKQLIQDKQFVYTGVINLKQRTEKCLQILYPN